MAHGNARSLTHWAKPGIEPMSSWIPMLVGFITTELWRELISVCVWSDFWSQYLQDFKGTQYWGNKEWLILGYQEKSPKALSVLTYTSKSCSCSHNIRPFWKSRSSNCLDLVGTIHTPYLTSRLKPPRPLPYPHTLIYTIWFHTLSIIFLLLKGTKSAVVHQLDGWPCSLQMALLPPNGLGGVFHVVKLSFEGPYKIYL